MGGDGIRIGRRIRRGIGIGIRIGIGRKSVLPRVIC